MTAPTADRKQTEAFRRAAQIVVKMNREALDKLKHK